MSTSIPCPLCSRRLCDHTPNERGQTVDQMMGTAPLVRRPHFVSESCKGEKCGRIVDLHSAPLKRCGRPAKHKLGEEIMHDDPNPARHNLTQYVCCFCYVQTVGPAAIVFCGCDLSVESESTLT